MPNWCECNLIIKGKGKELKKFQAFAKEGKSVLSFNKFISYPEHFCKQDEQAKKIKKGCIKDGFNSGGCEWRVQSWGTKWDLDDNVSVHLDDKSLIYQFDTAWSPPAPVVFAMSSKFPLLTFMLKYDEPGNRFKGKYKVKAGKVLQKQYTEY